jgi:hypothetical protein
MAVVESDRSSTLLRQRTGTRSSRPMAMVVMVAMAVEKLSREQVVALNLPETMAGAKFFGEFQLHQHW